FRRSGYADSRGSDCCAGSSAIAGIGTILRNVGNTIYGGRSRNDHGDGGPAFQSTYHEWLTEVTMTTTTPAIPEMMRGMSDPEAMSHAIQICQECHSHCLREAMQKCLELGGPHVQPEHLRLMLNCAEMCQTCANFMLSASPLHGKVCGVCAEVCE